MNIFGWRIFERKAAESVSIDTIIRRLEAVHETLSGISVSPDSAMQSPTVHAIVTGVSRRIESLPVHVMRSVQSGDRARKERLPQHPVQRLLDRPNSWQTSAEWWLDQTQRLLLWGNAYAFKARGLTGPIRRLEPLLPGSVDVEQEDDLSVVYKVHRKQTGAAQEYEKSQIHHVRGPARDGVKGDSPVMDVREAIALEVAAEKFGASLFGNFAVPGMVLQIAQGSRGFRTQEDLNQFVKDFQNAYTRRGRFRGMVLPSGLEVGAQIPVENDKAQFLETRRHQRSVIAGAFGVPPHLVGDLERATFSNIEEQSREMVQAVILPTVRLFEAAMERDLLTDDDRRSGVIIRFNLDGQLRGNFRERQEGLKIQREMGVINPNDWLEHENMNPRTDPGGEEYWDQGPSGQGGPAGRRPNGAAEGMEDEPDADATTRQ